MLCFQLHTLLVALMASVLLARANAAPLRDTLAEVLRADTTDEGSESFSQMLLLKIMSDIMTRPENEVLPGMEELGLREEVTRQLPLSQRERKAGCRNFFWKTFTSC